MKNYIVACLILICGLSFFACKKKDDLGIDVERGDYVWRPFFNTSRTSKNITLQLPEGNPYIDFIGLPPQDPDFFDVYFGDNPQDLKLEETIEFGDDDPVFKNLDKNKAYYFQVITRKEGFPSDTSQLLMTVIGKAPNPNFTYSNLTQGVEQFQFSFDRNHFIFTENRGKRGVFYQEKDSQTANRIGDNIFDVEWSPIKTEFIYLSRTIMDNKNYPLAPIIYELATKQIDTIFTIPFGEYYIHSLNFMPNGQQLSFLSSENNAENYQYDFWSYDLVTKTRQKH